jgi:ABC-type antimicrobial peptide transport system permease subunit
LRDVIADAIWIPRFSAWIFAAMSLMALALIASGIYAVVAYTSALRMREIGIRVAVGAAPQDIATDFLRRITIPLAAGAAIGVAAAVVLSRLVASLLYEVSANDPVTYVTCFALLIWMGAIAAIRPAWKAATQNPLASLRTE